MIVLRRIASLIKAISWTLLQSGVPVVLLLMSFPGCGTLPTFGKLSQLPGFSSPPAAEELVYDPHVQAFRMKGHDSEPGPFLRTVTGKKIQTEEELHRVLAAWEQPEVGTGIKATAYGLVGLYAPFNVMDALILFVPNVLLGYANSTMDDWRGEVTETLYLTGREHFDHGEYRDALEVWYKLRVMQMELHSDVDYRMLIIGEGEL